MWVVVVMHDPVQVFGPFPTEAEADAKASSLVEDEDSEVDEGDAEVVQCES